MLQYGHEAPIPVQLGDLNDLFHKIVSVAERCQLNIHQFEQKPFADRALMYVPLLAGSYTWEMNECISI